MRARLWRIWRIALAAILFYAAGAKALAFTEIAEGDGLLANRLVLLLAIGFESAAASFIAFGRTEHAWVVAVGTFVFFSVVSSYAMATGRDCDCISSGPTPNTMLLVDVTVLLITVPQKPSSFPQWGSWKNRCCLVSLIVGVTFSFCGIMRDSWIPRNNRERYLLANNLINHQWPIGSDYHPALSQLESGEWVILVLNPTCDNCSQIVSRFFPDGRSRWKDVRVATFVSGPNAWHIFTDRIALSGIPSAVVHWRGDAQPIVSSPAAFAVTNGMVIESADGRDTQFFLAGLHNNKLTEE